MSASTTVVPPGQNPIRAVRKEIGVGGTFDQTLADQFHFDRADLAANRRLRWSAAQRRARRPFEAWLLGRGRPLAILGFVAFLMLEPALEDDTGRSDTLVVGLCVAILVISLIGIIVVASRPPNEATRIHVVDGAVFVRRPALTVDPDEQRSHAREVTIGNVSFLVDPDAAAVFEVGTPYRIYYSDYARDNSPTILSVERSS